MPHPQSLLAELRALEARRAQGGLSPAEEARLSELQAVSGAAPVPHGFDVNAAAAAIRDSLQPAGAARQPPVPLPLPQPDVGALGPRTPPLEAEPVVPEALPPAAEEDLAPPPGIEAGAPEGYDLVAPSPAPPQDQAPTQEYDVVPAFDASSVPEQWDPNTPWDPGAAAAAWDADAAARGAEGGAVAPEQEAGPGEAAWALAAEEPFEPAAPQKPDHDTASWDLSGGAGPAMVVPDEGDPGATAVWSVGQAAEVAGTPLASQLPEGWAPDVEPAFLDELQLESDGSFALPGAGAAAAQPPADAWPGAGSSGEAVPASPEEAPPGDLEPAGPPAGDLLAAQPAEAAPDLGAPAAEPVEVSEDQILEVGDSVVEVSDDIPTLEGAELVEEVEPAPTLPAADATAPLPAEPEPAPPVRWVSTADTDLTAPEPGLPAGAELSLPPAAAEPSPPPPAAEKRAGGEPAPEGEPVPLESLTIDEAPLEVAAPAPVPPPAPAPVAAPVVAPAAAAVAAAQPQRIVAGLHRVVVHTVEGQVKRGSLADPDLEASELLLSPQPSGATEALPAERVRAIFFMLGAGEKPPAPEGMKVRVTFKDGRQVAGFSPDYDPRANGFFMIPADTRTNTARIWVYRSAVRQVSVS